MVKNIKKNIMGIFAAEAPQLLLENPALDTNIPKQLFITRT